MTITLVAVGRFRPGPEADLFEHYRRRLSWPLQLIEVEERRKLPATVLIEREAELLRAAWPKEAVVVALDPRGALLDSPAFAGQLGRWRDAGRRSVAFVIGGALGLEDQLRRSADLLLAFGTMTWPHLLVRGLLAEQIYRAECILANHPYHRH